ncbi:MAG: transposase [Phycisphaerae bacterium]|nr:transposase [Phycisphaerae bacterium]
MRYRAREPLAYLLTWTTYGTWLRGDRRGYVGRTLRRRDGVAPMRNEYGTPYDADDGRTYNWDANALKSSPANLTQDQAVCAAEAFCEVGARSGYELIRASVMSDHVHVLVSAHPDGKNEIFRRLKNVSAVRLTQRYGRPQPMTPRPRLGGTSVVSGGAVNEGGRWWTKGGSQRENWDEAAVAAAVEYVAGQEHKLAEVIDGVVVRRVAGERGCPPAKAGGS